MNDNSIKNNTNKIEAEIVDSDEVEEIELKEVDQEYSTLLPVVAQDSSVARVDPLTAYLNEIRL